MMNGRISTWAHSSLVSRTIAQAIEHLKKAPELAPELLAGLQHAGLFLPAGGRLCRNAEQAFKKYIELIPNDPNPYDSYAELLLKMGKFPESIEQYRKALTIDPHFVPSHFGISADLMYMGKPGEAKPSCRRWQSRRAMMENSAPLCSAWRS